MAITKLSNSGIATGGVLKYDSMLAGNAAYSPYAYESIASVLVGAGGATTVEFTSIPTTFTHLQLRTTAQTSGGAWGYVVDDAYIQFGNNTIDTGANYAWHNALSSGTGSPTVGSAASTSTGVAWGQAGGVMTNKVNANMFAVAVLDILDYANTNKYKTVRVISGSDSNGSGPVVPEIRARVGWTSGLWISSSAINRIKLYPGNSTHFSQYSRFSLYGIRSA